MRHIHLVFLAISSLALTQVHAQQVEFSSDEMAIYQDFLLHYPDHLGDLIGMQQTTGDFSQMKRFSHAPFEALNLAIPTRSDRKLPAEIMQLTSEEIVTRRIADAGRLVPIEKRNSPTRPDGYVSTQLQLSEIAFDHEHELAVLIYNARCAGKCGEGGVVLYRHTEHGWRREQSLLDYWVS
jgi:hypothetical protein